MDGIIYGAALERSRARRRKAATRRAGGYGQTGGRLIRELGMCVVRAAAGT